MLSKIIHYIKCNIFNAHEYYIIKEFNPTTRQVGCKYCKKKWGMNDNVKAFVLWDNDLEELYKGILNENISD